MNLPVLFIAAEPRECTPWVSKWVGVHDAQIADVHWSRAGTYHGVPMMAIANGAGADRARLAALAAPPSRAICSIGFCGALDPALGIGDIFIATEVASIRLRRAATGVGTMPPANRGTIASVAYIATTAVQKRQLRSTGAAAVEMEASGVLDAAEQLAVPFYCIRAVSDLAEEDFGIDFNLFLMPDGRFDVKRLISHACFNPVKRFGELIRLSRRTALASKNLGEFLARCSF